VEERCQTKVVDERQRDAEPNLAHGRPMLSIVDFGDRLDEGIQLRVCDTLRAPPTDIANQLRYEAAGH
jgi:hypothetical protein